MLTSTLNLYIFSILFLHSLCRFPPHMRQYLYGNKRRFWQTLLFCCLIAALLAPAIHSHDHSHDDGGIHHDLIFNLPTAPLYDTLVHYAGEKLGENLFAPGTNSTDFSRHDHSGNPHSHSLERLPLTAKRSGGGGLEKLKSFFIKAAASTYLPFRELPCKNYCYASPVTHPASLEFIFIATDLPPPIV